MFKLFVVLTLIGMASAASTDCKAGLEAMMFSEKSQSLSPEKMLELVNKLKAIYDKVPVSLDSGDITRREFISHMHNIGNVDKSNCNLISGYDFVVEGFKRQYRDWTLTGYLDFAEHFQKKQHELCGE